MRAADVEALALAATDWMVAHLDDVADDASLYHGRPGVALALLEVQRHVGDERYAAPLSRIADSLEADVDRLDDASLFFGLTGVGVALDALGRAEAATVALARVRSAHDGSWFGPMRELLMGNAGVALGALAVGDLDLALDAVAPYLSTADATPGGVNWAVRPSPARSHHVAHGTLGIVRALASVGRATGRDDLVDLALAGAADVVARNEAGPEGFLVPHSDPPHRPELIERFSYGWCNGPAGDAGVFRLLADVTGDDAWVALQERCRHTVRASGLPARLRPGFWDNHGRCCGTAGVLAFACEQGDLELAGRLVDDLATRAVVDAEGARWSNHEHRADPSDLPPRPGWAMGNAGIAPQLLRHVRLARVAAGESQPTG